MKIPSKISKSLVDLRKRYVTKKTQQGLYDFLRRPLVKRILLVAVVIIAVYGVSVGVTGYFIYKRHVQNRWTHLMELAFPYPVATANGQVVSLKRFRLEVTAREHYAAAHSIPNNQKDTEQFVMDKLVNDQLYVKALNDNHVLLHDSDVQAKLDEIYKEVGGQDKLAKFLHENYGDQIDLAQFRIWIRDSLVESAVQNQLLTRAKVRHILVSLPDNASDAVVTDAKNRITDIRGKINPDLSNFGDVAKQYSEDISSRDKGGSLGTTVEGSDALSFSQDFENAVFSLPVGQLSQPIRSRYGWHLIVVDERAGSINMSLKNYTEKLRKEGGVRFFYKI